MKKQSLLIFIVLFLSLTLLLQVPGSAGECYEGCTPGYWKQPHHLDSWPVDSELYFDEVFDLVGIAPHITLWDAVGLRGGGENRFIAHAVAAYLNQEHTDVCYPSATVPWFVKATYTDYDPPPFEEKIEILNTLNELGCPLN
jgi:hypothetical protein